MQSQTTYIATASGVRAEYLSFEARGTYRHSLELKHSPTGASKHHFPILRTGTSGKSSGIYATLESMLCAIEFASPSILDEKPLIQRPEVLVELIQRYSGLSGHEKVRALEIARTLPDAITLARRKKRDASRRAA